MAAKMPVCHRLSVVTPAPVSPLFSEKPSQASTTFVGCLGAGCALFVADPRHPLGGACGDLVHATAMAHLAAVAEASFTDGDSGEEDAPTQAPAQS